MRLVGFIQEHDKVIEADPFKNIMGPSNNNEEIVSKLISYLKKGVLIMGWMGYCQDLENGNLISPHGYYTDGEWIWPSYFSYYINKYPNYKLDKDFIDYLAKRDFVFHFPSKINLNEMELLLTNKLDGK